MYQYQYQYQYPPQPQIQQAPLDIQHLRYKMKEVGKINNSSSSNQLKVVSSSYYGLTRVKNQNGLFGFIDSKYNLVIPCVWEYAGDFRCKRACVKNDNGLYGYVDLTGSLIISCRFNHAEEFFNNGIAKVKDVQGNDYYIDVNGQRLKDNSGGNISKDNVESKDNKEDNLVKKSKGFGCPDWLRVLLGTPIYCAILGGIIGLLVNQHESFEMGLILGAGIGFLFACAIIIETLLKGNK